MTSTIARSASTGSRPGTLHLALPLAVITLALAACAGGVPAIEPTEQESTVQSSTPEPSAGAVPTGSGSAAPPAAAGTSALLTVSIRQDASANPVQYVLECVDGVPGPASTLPGADAACAALGRLGTGFFTARPRKDLICTQQYGGPQTASITGDLNGTSIAASFALTDGCEISRWQKVQDILGVPGAQ